jgi:hypothetical protein
MARTLAEQLCATGVAMFLSAVPAMAQQTPPSSIQQPPPALESPVVDPAAQAPSTTGDQTTDDQGKPADQEKSKDNQSSGTSRDRLFWALPNFLTVENGQHMRPLTTKQKFDVTARGTFDPIELTFYASLGGISQWEDEDPSYGQGAAGYSKRFALTVVDGTTENFLVTAILPSALHQDPRYFRLGKGGAWHRMGYAISRLFVTRTDGGHAQFNFSEILGSATAAGLSNVYHPAADRTVSNTLSTWWNQVSYDALAIVVKEFWPDLHHKVSRTSR